MLEGRRNIYIVIALTVVIFGLFLADVLFHSLWIVLIESILSVVAVVVFVVEIRRQARVRSW